MSDALSDLIARFELEVRTPRQRILLDAFLPAPETIASAIPPPPPPQPAAADEGIGFVQRLRAEERVGEPAGEPAPEPAPAPRPRRPKRDSAASKSLQEEIEEFMSSKGAALAPEPDPDP